MLRDRTIVEVVGFKQDNNRGIGFGTVLVSVNKNGKHTPGEVPNTTVNDFIEKASKRIGTKNVVNMIGQSRYEMDLARKQDSQDISSVRCSFNGKKRSREVN